MAQANNGRTQPPWSGAASLRRIASHFLKFTQSYSQHFNVAHQNVSDNARAYTTGLVAKALRKNMERMEEYVEDCEYESLQQFLSDSPWCHEGLNKHIAGDVNDLLGDPDGVLAVDESGFAKKGRMSVGVARQWNGREGKTDNCQVGVYAALSDGVHAAIVDFRLYLPKEWTEDKDRCLRAKIPEEKCKFKTKPELAVEMVETALANGLLFRWVAMDAFYGQVPQCVRSIDRRGLNFVADVHRNQIVYTEDPRPYLPRRKDRQGRKPTQLRAQTEGIRVDDLYKEEKAASWHRIRVRQGTKGVVFVQARRRRLWLWDGEEKTARNWWLVVIRDPLTNEIKWFISNAKATVTLTTLVRKHATRFWIERVFQDAKTSVGMADYQARGWIAWHHHMSLVMLALLFLLKQRRLHQQEVALLSCQDIVELLNHYLPRTDLTEEALLANLKRRHRARQRDIDSAYRRQQNRCVNSQ
jgi:SRSO17 transposase